MWKSICFRAGSGFGPNRYAASPVGNRISLPSASSDARRFNGAALKIDDQLAGARPSGPNNELNRLSVAFDKSYRGQSAFL